MRTIGYHHGGASKHSVVRGQGTRGSRPPFVPPPRSSCRGAGRWAAWPRGGVTGGGKVRKNAAFRVRHGVFRLSVDVGMVFSSRWSLARAARLAAHRGWRAEEGQCAVRCSHRPRRCRRGWSDFFNRKRNHHVRQRIAGARACGAGGGGQGYSTIGMGSLYDRDN